MSFWVDTRFTSRLGTIVAEDLSGTLFPMAAGLGLLIVLPRMLADAQNNILAATADPR
eukprot:COSAG01_NODE_7079_length_3363_cov_2.237439_3_plen_58_part_00